MARGLEEGEEGLPAGVTPSTVVTIIQCDWLHLNGSGSIDASYLSQKQDQL